MSVHKALPCSVVAVCALVRGYCRDLKSPAVANSGQGHPGACFFGHTHMTVVLGLLGHRVEAFSVLVATGKFLSRIVPFYFLCFNVFIDF